MGGQLQWYQGDKGFVPLSREFEVEVGNGSEIFDLLPGTVQVRVMKNPLQERGGRLLLETSRQDSQRQAQTIMELNTLLLSDPCLLFSQHVTWSRYGIVTKAELNDNNLHLTLE